MADGVGERVAARRGRPARRSPQAAAPGTRRAPHGAPPRVDPRRPGQAARVPRRDAQGRRSAQPSVRRGPDGDADRLRRRGRAVHRHDDADRDARAAAGCAVPGRPAAGRRLDHRSRVLRSRSCARGRWRASSPGAETGHDHFFATFGKFGLATVRKGDMLAAVAQINAAQNVLYLETLVSRQGDAVRTLAKQVGFDADFAAMRAKLLADGMARGRARGERRDRRRRGALRRAAGLPHAPAATGAAGSCGATTTRSAARPTRRSCSRTSCSASSCSARTARYVGVNLVQPEDNAVALRDYTLQMRMIRYLRSVYPRAHVTLHAGEIVPGLVAPGRPALPHPPGRRGRGRRADRPRRRPRPRDRLPGAAADDGPPPRPRRDAADQQRADPRRVRGRAPVHALPRGGRAGRAGDRRRRRVADRPHRRVRVRGDAVRPALPRS